ncbi:brain and acute leukemia cytoplasmic protein isoform X1 [Canis lupus familiaris]|uniref:brain and acute leukemia cytoplasmic protein isoform X1 n=1 Tax=Canis lupus familiaris TaxID=9615 RepID=UPI0015F158C3|nr:brain and acute leukemia cytoplasmic protein isoform X1 [Canis lupus familiaris]XP_038411183.1 brain and acute leukemia cytoplasmic protein isoform X1 [Canis lupus familiaris]XP_038540696.1 brain and acute leukemia cytoplasmic protein isoform X1 [Canis lupus familiaris]
MNAEPGWSRLWWQDKERERPPGNLQKLHVGQSTRSGRPHPWALAPDANRPSAVLGLATLHHSPVPVPSLGVPEQFWSMDTSSQGSGFQISLQLRDAPGSTPPCQPSILSSPSATPKGLHPGRERVSSIWSTLCYRNISENGQEPKPQFASMLQTMVRGVLEDGLSSNGIPRSAAPGGISNPEKKMSCGTQCPNPQSLTSGPLTQKQNGLRTMEVKRDAKRMSAKEVTINVTESIRQVDRNRRMAKNCVN